MKSNDKVEVIDTEELAYIESHQVDDYKIAKMVEHDASIEDGIKIYFREINKYPLLSMDEVKEYATYVKDPHKKKLLKLVDKDGCRVYNLNVDLLFNSLCDNSSYNQIINDILNTYSTLNNMVIDGDILFQYQQESNKRNRALNKEELKSIFNIDTNEKLSQIDLLKEVKSYIDYRYGFDKLFVSNLRLVTSIAASYSRKCSLDMNELINEGNLGLINAINKYDVSMGFKFSTYAVYWIKQIIRRTIINSGSMFRLPARLYASVMEFNNRVRLIEQQRQRELQPEEIAEILATEEIENIENNSKKKASLKDKEMIYQIKLKMVNEYLEYLQEPLRLDQTISKDDDFSVKELIPSSINVEENVLQDVLKEEIKEVFKVLKPREIEVIKMRWGLCEYDGMTYAREEIGKILHVSQQCVEQIEKKALKKMQILASKDEKVKALKLYKK